MIFDKTNIKCTNTKLLKKKKSQKFTLSTISLQKKENYNLCCHPVAKQTNPVVAKQSGALKQLTYPVS